MAMVWSVYINKRHFIWCFLWRLTDVKYILDIVTNIFWTFSSLVMHFVVCCRGGSRMSGKGVHINKGVGVRFTDFISFFLNIPWKWNNLVSLRPNYVIFIGYLKTGARRGGGGVRVNPWTPSGSATVLLTFCKQFGPWSGLLDFTEYI